MKRMTILPTGFEARRTTIVTTLALLGLLVSAPPARAQSSDDEDSPGRGVARISLMNGDVSVRRGDSGDWVAAAINAPLLAEDRVLTSGGARAEIQFDYYHRLRLAPDSEVRLAQLDNRMYIVQVARGLVTFNALKGGDAQVEISTPAASVRPRSHGEYRILIQGENTAEVTVRDGEAEIYTPRGSQMLRGGRTLLVRLGEGGEAEFQPVATAQRDAWDQFNEERNRELSRSKSYQYVSRDIYGAEDLDRHGDWSYVAPYGYVWSPTVAVGWSPYRSGRWTWMDYYGWSWVSYDPWGWAPYHYGRWFYSGARWCWYPGQMYGHRHHWSPALVGWIGWNSYGGFSAGIGIGWGAVGWVPLAPYEPLHRWWGRGYYGGYRNTTIINNTTIVNNTNVTNMYRNARVDRGVTVVEGREFSRGGTGRPLHVSSHDLTQASISRGAVPVAPGRESLRMSEREVSPNIASRNSSMANERFVSRSTPARVDRVSFDQQRSALEQVASRRAGAPERGASNSGSMAAPGRSSSPERAGGASMPESRQSNGGWRSVDSGNRTSPSGNAPSGREAAPGSDWRGFGDPSRSSRFGGDSSSNASPGSRSSDTTATSPSRSGWQSFGNPSGSSSSAPGRSAEPGARTDTGNREMPSRGWSTGGGSRSSESPSRPSENAGSGWSTGGSSNRGETPSRSSGSDRGGWSTGGSSSSGRSSEAPSRGGSSDRGGWSTGGGTSSGSTASPGRSSESPSRGSWSTGGGSSSGSSSGSGGAPSRGSSGSSSPSRGRGNEDFTSSGGSWSTGGRGSSMNESSRSSYSVPRSSEDPSGSFRGSYGGGRSSGSYSGGGYSGGGSSSPSYSAPSRSSSGGGFGGGNSGMSSGRSSGGSYSAPSSGSFGGGSRSSGGGFSGGSRSSGGFSGGGGGGGSRSSSSGGGHRGR